MNEIMNRSFAYSKNPLFHRRLFIEVVIAWKFPGLEYFLSELPYLALHSITKELPLLLRFQRMILFLRVVMFKGLQTTTFTNDRIWYPTVNGVVSWTNSTDAHIGVVRWGYQSCRCYSNGANVGQLVMQPAGWHGQKAWNETSTYDSGGRDTDGYNMGLLAHWSMNKLGQDYIFKYIFVKIRKFQKLCFNRN